MTASNKALVVRLYDDVFNRQQTSLVNDLAVPDYVEHSPLPGQRDGRDGLGDRVGMLISGLAPHFDVRDVVAEGDRVCVRWSNTGTHVGEFLGIPPTDRSFTTTGIDIYRIEQGRLAEHWDVVDQLGMMQQLGLIPSS